MLPNELFVRLRERADRARRTLEAELIDMLGSALHDQDELPPDLDAEIVAVELLTDAESQQLARSPRLRVIARALERLHLKRDREGLTPSEREESATLLRQYERVMLLRARALLLLKQRGLDADSFVRRS